MTDSENSQPEGGMPQPIPVFDVTCDHVYHGGVPKPFYIFLWSAVAFVIGSLLPWGSDPEAPMSLLQVFMLIGGIGATWCCIASIRSRRLSLGGLMMAELVALVCVVFFSQWTAAEYNAQRIAERTLMKTAAESASGTPQYEQLASAYNERVAADQEGLYGKVFQAPFSHFTTDAGSSERADLLAAWDVFGTGFYVVALNLIFVAIFLLFSIVMAMSKGKKPEAPVRRPSRRGGSDSAASEKDDAAEGAADGA